MLKKNYTKKKKLNIINSFQKSISNKINKKIEKMF